MANTFPDLKFDTVEMVPRNHRLAHRALYEGSQGLGNGQGARSGTDTGMV